MRQRCLEIVRAAFLDAAQHRHQQTVRRINGDADIDVGQQPAAGRLAVVPGIKRWFGAAGGDHCAYQTQHDVLAGAPGMNVGVVHQRRRGDFRMRERHALCHHPAHAAQQFLRAEFGEYARGALHIVTRDQAPGTGRCHHRQIDIEAARQRAHRRCRLDAVGQRCRRGRRVGNHAFADLDLADNTAGIGIISAFKAHQRRADMGDVVFVTEQTQNFPRVGRGNIDDRLGRFDRHQRLVLHDRIAGLDVPVHDFGVLQAFAEVREFENSHDCLVTRIRARTIRRVRTAHALRRRTVRGAHPTKI